MAWEWGDSKTLAPRQYLCGYCQKRRYSKSGYLATLDNKKEYAYIYICPECTRPSFFSPWDDQIPSPTSSKSVKFISEIEIERLFQEARKCALNELYAASAICSRKLLMNIAVGRGAAEKKSFAYYVDHLANLGFLPPDGKKWVDLIRTKGNEAAHEIKPTSKQDAEDLLSFLYMLLVFIYEFPGMIESRIETEK